MNLVNLTFQINLRDVAAFEDLAAELGYEIYDISIESVENGPTPFQKKSKHQVTEKITSSVLAFMKKNPGATAAEVKEALSLPHATSTICRIRAEAAKEAV